MNRDALKKMPFYLTDEQIGWVESTRDGMSLREKCAQLFCILGDASSEEDLKRLVGDWGVGAVLYRPDKKERIQEKFRFADELARIPLLHAANLEEGGAGIITDGTYFASNLQVAAADDPAFAESFAKVCAKEGREAGVNWTFSPVVDIDMNYMNPITNVRTFGSDPEKVLKNARAFTHILQENGIAASCKHFPGDGVDYRDQHLHPSWNTLSAEEWFASYGRIYEELIRDGLMSIMAGHIVQPNVIRAVDPSAGEEDMLPGSQSRQMLTGVLRERYGFNGVIITDATIMGGYTMSMARSEAIPRTLMAGCDMFCFGTDIFEDITYLMEAVEDGRVSTERLDEALTRVLAMKAALAAKEKTLQAELTVKGEASVLGKLALTDAALEQKRCAEAAVTLVKDKGGILPVSAERYPRIRLAVLGSDDTFDGSLRQMAGDFLRGRGFEVEDYDPMEDDLHGTRNIPDDRLYLILCNMPAASNQTTVRISWCPKHAMEIPRFVNEEASVFISFANPYHLQDIPRVRTYINAYTATRAAVEAALGKLTGTGSFTGVSPVDPFCGLPDTRL